MRFGIPRAFLIPIGVATEVFGRGERDRIDSLLQHHLGAHGKSCDPMGERSDELFKLAGGQRSIDPAISLG
jgi:hypothetical protein